MSSAKQRSSPGRGSPHRKKNRTEDDAAEASRERHDDKEEEEAAEDPPSDVDESDFSSIYKNAASLKCLFDAGVFTAPINHALVRSKNGKLVFAMADTVESCGISTVPLKGGTVSALCDVSTMHEEYRYKFLAAVGKEIYGVDDDGESKKIATAPARVIALRLVGGPNGNGVELQALTADGVYWAVWMREETPQEFWERANGLFDSIPERDMEDDKDYYLGEPSAYSRVKGMRDKFCDRTEAWWAKITPDSELHSELYAGVASTLKRRDQEAFEAPKPMASDNTTCADPVTVSCPGCPGTSFAAALCTVTHSCSSSADGDAQKNKCVLAFHASYADGIVVWAPLLEEGSGRLHSTVRHHKAGSAIFGVEVAQQESGAVVVASCADDRHVCVSRLAAFDVGKRDSDQWACIWKSAPFRTRVRSVTLHLAHGALGAKVCPMWVGCGTEDGDVHAYAIKESKGPSTSKKANAEEVVTAVGLHRPDGCTKVLFVAPHEKPFSHKLDIVSCGIGGSVKALPVHRRDVPRPRDVAQSFKLPEEGDKLRCVHVMDATVSPQAYAAVATEKGKVYIVQLSDGQPASVCDLDAGFVTKCMESVQWKSSRFLMVGSTDGRVTVVKFRRADLTASEQRGGPRILYSNSKRTYLCSPTNVPVHTLRIVKKRVGGEGVCEAVAISIKNEFLLVSIGLLSYSETDESLAVFAKVNWSVRSSELVSTDVTCVTRLLSQNGTLLGTAKNECLIVADTSPIVHDRWDMRAKPVMMFAHKPIVVSEGGVFATLCFNRDGFSQKRCERFCGRSAVQGTLHDAAEDRSYSLVQSGQTISFADSSSGAVYAQFSNVCTPRLISARLRNVDAVLVFGHKGTEVIIKTASVWCSASASQSLPITTRVVRDAVDVSDFYCARYGAKNVTVGGECSRVFAGWKESKSLSINSQYATDANILAMSFNSVSTALVAVGSKSTLSCYVDKSDMHELPARATSRSFFDGTQNSEEAIPRFLCVDCIVGFENQSVQSAVGSSDGQLHIVESSGRPSSSPHTSFTSEMLCSASHPTRRSPLFSVACVPPINWKTDEGRNIIVGDSNGLLSVFEYVNGRVPMTPCKALLEFRSDFEAKQHCAVTALRIFVPETCQLVCGFDDGSVSIFDIQRSAEKINGEGSPDKPRTIHNCELLLRQTFNIDSTPVRGIQDRLIISRGRIFQGIDCLCDGALVSIKRNPEYDSSAKDEGPPEWTIGARHQLAIRGGRGFCRAFEDTQSYGSTPVFVVVGQGLETVRSVT